MKLTLPYNEVGRLDRGIQDLLSIPKRLARRGATDAAQAGTGRRIL
jgi:hypothetical protein